VQQVLALAAVEVGVAQVDEDEVDIGPTGEDADAPVGHVGPGEPFGEYPGAAEGALLALGEVVAGGKLEGDGLGRDDMLERTTVLAGKTAELTFLAISASLVRMLQPRGPSRVL
jgi:hypothetical protein